MILIENWWYSFWDIALEALRCETVNSDCKKRSVLPWRNQRTDWTGHLRPKMPGLSSHPYLSKKTDLQLHQNMLHPAQTEHTNKRRQQKWLFIKLLWINLKLFKCMWGVEMLSTWWALTSTLAFLAQVLPKSSEAVNPLYLHSKAALYKQAAQPRSVIYFASHKSLSKTHRSLSWADAFVPEPVLPGRTELAVMYCHGSSKQLSAETLINLIFYDASQFQKTATENPEIYK